MRSKNAFRNLLFYLIYEVLCFILGIIFPRFIIHAYGSEINGLTSTITRILSLINLIQAGAVGTAIYQMYKPVVEKDYDKQSAIIYSSRRFYNKVSALYLVIALSAGIFYGFYLKSGNLSFVEIFLSFVILALNGTSMLLFNTICDIFVSSHQKRYFLSIASICEIVLRYGFLSIVLLLKLHFIFIYVCYLVGGLGSVIINYSIYKHMSKKIITKDPTDKSFKIPDRKYLMLSSIGSEMVLASPTIIITTFIDLVNSSIFSIYAMIFTSLKTILNSIQLSFSAIFGNLTKTADDSKIYEVYSAIELLTIFIGTISSCCVGFLIIPFINIYTLGFDTNYLFVNLAFFVVAYVLFFTFRTSFAYVATVYGLFKQTCKITLAFGIIGIVISAFCAIIFGMPYVMVGILFNEAGSGITTLIVMKKKISWFRFKRLLVRSGVMLSLTILSMGLFFIINPAINRWYLWVAYAFVVALTTLIVFSLYCLAFEKKYVSMYFNYVKALFRKRTN